MPIRLKRLPLCLCILCLVLELSAEERFQLRGIFELGGQARFSIHNSKTKETFWLPQTGMRHGLSVIEYKRESGLLHLKTPEGRIELTLRTSDGEPLDVHNDASIRAEQKARQAFISAPVSNPRLSRIIRERRSEGAIDSPSAIAGESSNYNFTGSAYQSQEGETSGEVERTPLRETESVQDERATGFAHGNPRVLVMRGKASK